VADPHIGAIPIRAVSGQIEANGTCFADLPSELKKAANTASGTLESEAEKER
jgi:hypothetical protein